MSPRRVDMRWTAAPGLAFVLSCSPLTPVSPPTPAEHSSPGGPVDERRPAGAVVIPPPAPTDPKSAESPPEQALSLEAFVREIRRILAERDMKALARFADPSHGIDFEPYAHVDPNGGVSLSAAELETAMTDPKLRDWGRYDGSGEPIRLTFRQYFDRFVSIPDIEHARQAIDQTLGTGNTSNNIEQAYPNTSFFELHHPGHDPQYDGMDWQSVRVVFRRAGGRYRIVAIVHDQWTI